MINLPWTEKYKSKNIEEMVLNDTFRQKMNNLIESQNLNNMIFQGSTGIGKSLLAKCLGYKLYDREDYNKMIIDYKDYKDKKEEIQNIYKMLFPKTKYKYRLLIVDDVDNYDDKIQNQILSCFNESVRIIFTCTNLENILEGLQSNCTIMKMNLTPQELTPKLMDILKKEKKNYTEEGLNLLCNYSKCDVRNSINLLQQICNRFNDVTIDNIMLSCNIPTFIVSETIMNHIVKKEISNIFEIIKTLEGYSQEDILLGLMYYLKFTIKIKEDIKIIVNKHIIKCLYDMSKTKNSDLSLLCCFIEIDKEITM